jgi:hypothetical protein
MSLVLEEALFLVSTLFLHLLGCRESLMLLWLEGEYLFSGVWRLLWIVNEISPCSYGIDKNYIPLYPSGKSTTLPFNFLPRKYAVLLLPSELTSGVQCLVVALTGPLCWIRQGSTLTAQLGVSPPDLLMASMLCFVFVIACH